VSDQVTCERCGQFGRRLRGHVGPEGWYFATFTLSPDSDHDPGDLLIVHACSEACRDALWTKMAGHRWDAIELRVDVPAELRRAAALHAGRLRDEARRISSGSALCEQGADTSAGAAFARVLERAAAALDQEAEAEIAALAPQPTSDPEGTLSP
jgi:hypothetical protein